MDSLQRNVSLANYTTFKTGGVATYLVSVSSEVELKEAINYAEQNQLPVLVLGGGSNLLVGDEGFSGLVIHMKIEGIESEMVDDEMIVTAGAGVVFDDLVSHTVGNGWWGLENLSHIPGSVGATPVQNVGAYGVEVGDCIRAVRVYDMDSKTFLTLSGEECGFSYRHSIFKETESKHYVITNVSFVLSVAPKPCLSYADLELFFSDKDKEITPTEIRNAVISIRSKKFPDWHEVGTAGSFFKNPIIKQDHYERLRKTYPGLPSYKVDRDHVKLPLGWIFDKVVGARGRQTGSVGCYQGQALVLVADADARTKDILDFAGILMQEVFETTGIKIEREVTLVGE